MGGDCLNVGCVPSKTLIASARHAHGCQPQQLQPYGLTSQGLNIDSSSVHQHLQKVIDEVGQRDSQSRFEHLGARVIRDTGRFVDKTTFETSQQRMQARKFVITTGSSPFIPLSPASSRSIITLTRPFSTYKSPFNI
jgi:pyruvate/2-oxoglutarate dehydrogenase complex dihydrolipoamide dehydrogenase (E3) component